MAEPKLLDFDPNRGVMCAKESGCYDPHTGQEPGEGQTFGKTKKIFCSRLCLVGGKYTQQNMMSRKNEKKWTYLKHGGGARGPHKGRGWAPVCLFKKIVKCKLEKAGKHSCTADKKITCVAILPGKDARKESCYPNKPHEWDKYQKPSDFKDMVAKADTRPESKWSGKALDSMQAECNFATDPCTMLGMYM